MIVLNASARVISSSMPSTSRAWSKLLCLFKAPAAGPVFAGFLEELRTWIDDRAPL